MKSNKNNSSNTETTKTETQTGDSQSTQIKDGVVVPSLTGKTMDQAKQELNGTGLGIRQAGTASSDTVEKGQIISQDPADGKTVEKNTTIEVIIIDHRLLYFDRRRIYIDVCSLFLDLI